MTLVVDASVALRWFVEAPGSDEAALLLVTDEPLIAPDLVVAEVVNAAWKLVRAGEITAEHGTRISAAVASSFTKLAPAAELAPRAFELALALDHPVYDCLYLALADLERSVLVSADQRLATRLAGSRWESLLRRL